ncbi:hypothetical protein BRAO375_1420046 [Bradyrhizobium sp. ORS 375]|nr:hypothetical protein BRAO375_1420046 [Bradyrhizobium sp. ORS 375]
MVYFMPPMGLVRWPPCLPVLTRRASLSPRIAVGIYQGSVWPTTCLEGLGPILVAQVLPDSLTRSEPSLLVCGGASLVDRNAALWRSDARTCAFSVRC